MKTIKFVSFHVPLFIPELGNVGDSLPSDKKSFPDLLMWEEDGRQGVSFSTGRTAGFIPDGNCKIYIYGEDKADV